MASKKKRKPISKGKTKPKFQPKRKRTFSEKAFMVVGIIIALSMILGLIVNFIPQIG